MWLIKHFPESVPGHLVSSVTEESIIPSTQSWVGQKHFFLILYFYSTDWVIFFLKWTVQKPKHAATQQSKTAKVLAYSVFQLFGMRATTPLVGLKTLLCSHIVELINKVDDALIWLNVLLCFLHHQTLNYILCFTQIHVYQKQFTLLNIDTALGFLH